MGPLCSKTVRGKDLKFALFAGVISNSSEKTDAAIFSNFKESSSTTKNMKFKEFKGEYTDMLAKD